MRHKKKIVFLAIISLLVSESLPHFFSNSEKREENGQVAQAQLCCCGTGASSCQDCCCSKDFGENEGSHEMDVFKATNNAGKRSVMTTPCGSNPDYASISTELTYLISQFIFVHYSPFTSLLETAALKPDNPLLTPLYKPPKLSLLPLSLI